ASIVNGSPFLHLAGQELRGKQSCGSYRPACRRDEVRRRNRRSSPFGPASAGLPTLLSSDIDPTGLKRGFRNGADEFLYPQAGRKAERFGTHSRDGFEVTRDFDGLEIIEAELMAGGDAEQAIGGVVGTGLDAPEALASGRIGAAVEMQLVETFLREQQRALAAIDLEIVLHLAAGRD